MSNDPMLEKMSLIDPKFVEDAVYPEKTAHRRRGYSRLPRVAMVAALIAAGGSMTALAAGYFINHNTQKNYVESFAPIAETESPSEAGEKTETAEVQVLSNPDSGNRLSIDGSIQDVSLEVERVSRDDNIVQFEIRMDFDESVNVDAVRQELESETEALGQDGYILGATMFFNTPQQPNRGFHTSYLDDTMIGSMDFYGLEDPMAAMEEAYPEEEEDEIPAICAQEWDGWGEFRGDSLYIYPSIRWDVTAGEDISGTHTLTLEFGHLFFDGAIHEGTWKCSYEMDTLSYRDTLVLTPMDLQAAVGDARRQESCALEEYAVTPNGVKIYGHCTAHDDLTADFSGTDTRLRAVAWDDLGNYYVSYGRNYDHTQYREDFTSEKVWDTVSANEWSFGDWSVRNDYSGDSLMEDQGKTYAVSIPEDAQILHVALEKEISHWNSDGTDYQGVDFELASEPVEIHLR